MCHLVSDINNNDKEILDILVNDAYFSFIKYKNHLNNFRKYTNYSVIPNLEKALILFSSICSSTHLSNTSSI